MKRNNNNALVVLAALVCFSLPLAAQSTIDFNSLSQTNHYLPIPSGFGGMNWGNLDYITFSGQNVGMPVFNTSAQTMSAANPGQSFHLDSLTVSAQTGVIMSVYGYNQGVFVGSQSYALSPSPAVLNIPSSWGNVTSVTFACYTHIGVKPALYELHNVTVQ
jgi:hypothetical protein